MQDEGTDVLLTLSLSPPGPLSLWCSLGKAFGRLEKSEIRTEQAA